MTTILTTLEYLDVIPGGRTEVGNMNIGAWFGAPANQLPLRIFLPKIKDLGGVGSTPFHSFSSNHIEMD